ncbi:hypothetical protein [Thalassococcus sp. S3]|nr:hypothetical protein [Thalassococcus sp. S3]
MNEQPQNHQHPTGPVRLRDWLSGEVRVSRAILVAGGVLLLALVGIALD